MITPELNELIIEEKKVDIQEKRFKLNEREWKSCCFQLEPQSSIFFAKLTISIMTIILCSYQLITEVDCSSRSLFSSILSSVVTFWLSNSKHSE